MGETDPFYIFSWAIFRYVHHAARSRRMHFWQLCRAKNGHLSRECARKIEVSVFVLYVYNGQRTEYPYTFAAVLSG